MTIEAWLKRATQDLTDAGIGSAALDGEIILAHTIKHTRAWLHAHADETLEPRCQEIADARLDLRRDHVPIAYIIGHKEFYGRRFQVSPATLIPRPESEQLIELLHGLLPPTRALEITVPKRLVDIGTGSGCLGITAKLEHPELDVTLLDTSKPALKVAEKNAAALRAEVTLLQSDLLASYPYAPDIVLANLPYVDRSWQINQEIRHEPSEALFASNHGLSVISRCFKELSTRMSTGGVALFEADPRQWKAVDEIARAHGFTPQSSQHGFARAYHKR